eukprot:CAMPEP_0198729358 /NCGR_PEP_ID=MMETSP1475-20131203/17474_1 /TAXON_ID= ORGANISM="Unidentified sp., Strain CCMP1999" /NCGR_SAMPLE_ID=MMETSP1475 /ASSEMBLY_ACC=CAM_ASM_001111 /LENGTH=221 /DNA_ID=CAMNT_0044491975 /DNA_START=371 /DNA_END=1033 /DNA_ORIENTATION=+
MAFVGAYPVGLHPRRSVTRRRRTGVQARSGGWRDVKLDFTDNAEDSKGGRMTTTSEDRAGLGTRQDSNKRSASDMDLVDSQNGRSVFNMIILVGSGLVLTSAGLGPILAKKLMFSSLTLTSLSSFGAFWVSRGLSGGKLPIVHKSIKISKDSSTIEQYVRNNLISRIRAKQEAASIQPVRYDNLPTESYFPILDGEERDVTEQQRVLGPRNREIVDEFSEW